jgi:serine/threonine/tyrosine protein kinase RAD53
MTTGQDFIRRLLEVDPTRRMTLADARSHTWLYRRHGDHMNVPRTPVQDPSVDSLPGDGTTFEDDEVMVAEQETGVTQHNRGSSEAVTVSNGLRFLQLSSGLAAQDSAANMVSSIPGAFLEGDERQLKAAPLQRRSKVVAQANEEPGTGLPEPSMEMIKRAEAQHSGPGATKGNKRLRSELTPMPEDEAPKSQRPEASSSRKKTKESEEEEEEEEEAEPLPSQTPRKPSNARGNGTPHPKGKATRVRGAPVAEEEDVGKPRRSTRASAQKAARR